MNPTVVIDLPALERAMKVQEVLTRAMAGQLKWYEAAQILGVTDRQMRRWKARYERDGYDGLLDRRRQRPSPRRIPMATATKVLTLYREQYFDFNVRHFYEELRREHDVQISYGWVKALLQEAGLVARAKKRGQYRRRRERRALPGLLVHLDGSSHRWFDAAPGEPERQDLLALLDDATGECLVAQLVPEEDTASVLALLKELIAARGTFVALYTDRASHFVYTPVAGEAPDRSKPTQVEQVLDELGIELIAAHSPQARGRSERAWRTMQGRLPQELRRAGATTYTVANAYLRGTFMPKFNARFAVTPRGEGTAFVPVHGIDLDRTIALRFERTVGRDHVVHFENRALQLPKVHGVATLADRKVQVRVQLDGTVEVLLGRRWIASFPAQNLNKGEEAKQKVA